VCDGSVRRGGSAETEMLRNLNPRYSRHTQQYVTPVELLTAIQGAHHNGLLNHQEYKVNDR